MAVALFLSKLVGNVANYASLLYQWFFPCREAPQLEPGQSVEQLLAAHPGVELPTLKGLDWDVFTNKAFGPVLRIYTRTELHFCVQDVWWPAKPDNELIFAIDLPFSAFLGKTKLHTKVAGQKQDDKLEKFAPDHMSTGVVWTYGLGEDSPRAVTGFPSVLLKVAVRNAKRPTKGAAEVDRALTKNEVNCH